MAAESKNYAKWSDQTKRKILIEMLNIKESVWIRQWTWIRKWKKGISLQK